MPHSRLQAELAAARGVKAEDSEDEDSDKDDGCSSASSVFGLDKTSAAPTNDGRKSVTQPTQPRTRPDSKTTVTSEPEQGTGTEATGLESKPPRSRRGSLPGAKTKEKDKAQESKDKENPLAAAHSALQLLQQISPASQWQGKIKEQDLQSRLKKAGAAIGDVQRFQGTLPEGSQKEQEDCERLLSGLGDLVAAAPLCRDVFCKLKAKEQVMKSLQDSLFQDELLKVFALDTLDMETTSSILSAIAQKVIEAGELYGRTGLSHSI